MPHLAAARSHRDAPPDTDCPGFCARCDRPTHVRLGAGPHSVEALCRACAGAQHQDVAASAGAVGRLRRTA
jgi:hypothetical protein